MSHEMTMCVRFCLSYYPLKCDFITFKMNNNSEENALLIQMLSMTLLDAPVCYYTRGHIIFMTQSYPPNNSDII